VRIKIRRPIKWSKATCYTGLCHDGRHLRRHGPCTWICGQSVPWLTYAIPARSSLNLDQRRQAWAGMQPRLMRSRMRQDVVSSQDGHDQRGLIALGRSHQGKTSHTIFQTFTCGGEEKNTKDKNCRDTRRVVVGQAPRRTIGCRRPFLVPFRPAAQPPGPAPTRFLCLSAASPRDQTPRNHPSCQTAISFPFTLSFPPLPLPHPPSLPAVLAMT
jgi:hypothetical protein